MVKIGIRREDKNIWEKRVPITPDHVRELRERYDVEFVIQPSDIRVFKGEEYKEAGAKVKEDLSACPIVFSVKEMPVNFFRPGGVYIFFSHTIKGQKHNMPMLKRLMELGCTLIDYEKVVDRKGIRLIFFGRHAGLAGMVDSLWAYGKRCELEGVKTPFDKLKTAHEYDKLGDIKDAIVEVGVEISRKGLPDTVIPFVCGFAGYGNVSKGAQEIFDLLPIREIKPHELISLSKGNVKSVYKVIFKEEDMVEPRDRSMEFELQDYYKHPEKYRGVFEKYAPHLSVMMNCIYWNTNYPRLVTRKFLKDLYRSKGEVKLKVIGDISCDVEGAVEVTVKCTDPGNPVFVYDVDKDAAMDGLDGNGPVVLAVDNLPCELPREASMDFSAALEDFIPMIAGADYSVPFEELNLPPEIKGAMIVHHGKLTPDYKYMEEFV